MQSNINEFKYLKFDRNRDILKQINFEIVYRGVDLKNSFFYLNLVTLSTFLYSFLDIERRG